MLDKKDNLRELRKKLFLPALAFAVFATTIIDVAAPLLLTDIAKTFQVQVGIAGSIRSSSSIAGVVVGLLMAVFSVRFKHKSLLIFGLVCECLAGVGSFLAPTLSFMNIAHFLDGVGSVMVAAMAYSLIGEYIPHEKRGGAVGWIVAAGSFGFIIGAPIIGLIANASEWRSVMIWFVFPVSAASLLFAYFALSSKSIEIIPIVRPPLLAGCKQTLSNVSALACLTGAMLFSGAAAMSVFLVSFWKYQFAINIGVGSVTIVVNSIVGAVGGVVAGRLLSRTGRKFVGVTAGLVESFLIISMVLMPTFSLSWGLSAARIWCFSFATTAFASLSLEQVPKFRSTMMSLFGAFSGLGTLLGVTIGGLTLDSFNYQATALVLGMLGIASVTIIAFLAKDPKSSVEQR